MIMGTHFMERYQILKMSIKIGTKSNIKSGTRGGMI